jgi:hypothetical protein
MRAMSGRYLRSRSDPSTYDSAALASNIPACAFTVALYFVDLSGALGRSVSLGVASIVAGTIHRQTFSSLITV